jgi:hypothetical protein
MLPDPIERPVIPLWPDAGRALGLGRKKSYEMAAAGTFPARVLRVGSRLRVVSADLYRFLGLDLPGRSPAAVAPDDQHDASARAG